MGDKYTEAQKRATLKYQANKVKVQITLDEEQRNKYHELAKKKDMSLTKLIISLLDAESERQGQE